MNPELTSWLETATKNLALAAKARVSEQILEHYQAALEHHAPKPEAEVLALVDLGSAEMAAKKFERVHLTTRELEQMSTTKTQAKQEIWLGVSAVFFALMLWNIFLLLQYKQTNLGMFQLLFTGIQTTYYFLRFWVSKSATLRQFVLFNLISNSFMFLSLCLTVAFFPLSEVNTWLWSIFLVLGIFLVRATLLEFRSWCKLVAL